MGATEEKMETERNVRKWAGWPLGAAVALQFYFVQELLAALALFAIGFAGVASVIVGLYGLQKGWQKAVTRIFGFDQVAARSLLARDSRLNGQAVKRSKLSQELKTRNRNKHRHKRCELTVVCQWPLALRSIRALDWESTAMESVGPRPD